MMDSDNAPGQAASGSGRNRAFMCAQIAVRPCAESTVSHLFWKARWLLLMIAPWLALAGCRGAGNSELLERELRDQEDQLYYLEDKLDESDAMLESARRENEALKKELSTGDRGASGAVTPTTPATPRSPLAPPGGRPSPPRPPRAQKPSDLPLKPPAVDLGEPSLPDPGAMRPESFLPRMFDNAALETGDLRVASIALNKQLTGGRNHDGKPGDDGLMVVIEPRNEAGQVIKAAGDISLVVVDPELRGAEARVARWDFTYDEAMAHFKKKGIGPGLQFELPWPDGAPKNGNLQLFARLVPADGRKLETTTRLDVDPPHQPSRKWTAVTPASAATPDAPAGSLRSVLKKLPKMPPLAVEPEEIAASVETATPAVVEEESAPPRPAHRPARRPVRASTVDALPVEEDVDPPSEPARRPARQASRIERPVWKPYR